MFQINTLTIEIITKVRAINFAQGGRHDSNLFIRFTRVHECIFFWLGCMAMHACQIDARDAAPHALEYKYWVIALET